MESSYYCNTTRATFVSFVRGKGLSVIGNEVFMQRPQDKGKNLGRKGGGKLCLAALLSFSPVPDGAKAGRLKTKNETRYRHKLKG